MKYIGHTIQTLKTLLASDVLPRFNADGASEGDECIAVITTDAATHTIMGRVEHASAHSMMVRNEYGSIISFYAGADGSPQCCEYGRDHDVVSITVGRVALW